MENKKEEKLGKLIEKSINIGEKLTPEEQEEAEDWLKAKGIKYGV